MIGFLFFWVRYSSFLGPFLVFKISFKFSVFDRFPLNLWVRFLIFWVFSGLQKKFLILSLLIGFLFFCLSSSFFDPFSVFNKKNLILSLLIGFPFFRSVSSFLDPFPVFRKSCKFSVCCSFSSFS